MVALALAILAGLSLLLSIWQWVEGRRFPVHARAATGDRPGPAVTLFKPLRGCDARTETCLRSWLTQDYPGPVQVLFGVADADDPVNEIVRRLQREFPHADMALVICAERRGLNAKVSNLTQLEGVAKYDLWVVSDADVEVPPDFLREALAPFEQPATGLVCPLYALGEPATAAMRWEAVCVNADFWTGVLQARRFGPLRFALGAVMAVRREVVARQGGFASLANVLADDFELGRRAAANGARIALSPVVVRCLEAPQNWRRVWAHQVRWSRTIRVCQPAPYAASLLSNATLWPGLWMAFDPRPTVMLAVAVCLAVRLATAADNQWRLTRSLAHLPWLGLVLVKDVLQCGLWALAFLGDTVEWRGERFRVKRNGELAPLGRMRA